MPLDHDLFQLLRDPCVELNDALRRAATLSPAMPAGHEVVEKLQNLCRVLEDSPVVLGDRLADYVFFPLTPIFRQPHGYAPAALELALRCLLPLLERGWTADDRSALAVQLLVLLTFLANPTAAAAALSDRVPAASSDEAVEQAFRCLSALFRSLRASPKSREGLLATANVPALGHTISTTLDVVVSHKVLSARLAALDALASFCEHIATKDVCRSFLPGVVSSLTRILGHRSRTRRPPYQVIERALVVLTAFIETVFCDDATAPVTLLDEITQKQLTAAFSTIFKLREHSRPEVRTALLGFCKIVLERCSATLWDIIPQFLEITVQLLGSDKTGDRQERAIEELRRLFDLNDRLSQALVTVLYDRLRILPSVMLLNDEERKMEAIEFAMACMTLVPHIQLHSISASKMARNSVRSSFANLLSSETQFNSSKVGLSTLEDSILDNRRHILQQPRTQESFPIVLVASSQSKIVLTKLQQLVVAVYDQDSHGVNVLTLLQEARFGESEQKLGALWISVLLARHALERESEMEELTSISTASQNDLELREELFAFAVDLLRDTNSGGSNRSSDTQLAFLALEVVAMRAAELGYEFRPELVDVLYPVVRLMASDLVALRTHAHITLDALARSCGYAHSRELIISNADYITNAVAAQLSVFDLSPEGPQTIRMLVQLCGVQLIGLLDDIIENVFESLDHFHGYPALVELLFSVLKSVVDEGASSEILNPGQHLKPSLRPTSFGTLVTNIKHKEQSIVEMDQKAAFQQYSAEDASQWEKDKGIQPTPVLNPKGDSIGTSRLYHTLLRIARLTQHHLPNSSPSVRVMLLSLLAKALPALASDEDSLLPLIHTLWPVLVPRLEDDEAYVVAAALDVITVVCETAGNFMSARIEALWPSFRKIHVASSDRSVHGRAGWQGSERHQMSRRPAFAQAHRGGEARRSALLDHNHSRTAAPASLRIADLSLRDPVADIAREPSPSPYVPTTTLIVQKALGTFLVALLGHVRISARMLHEIVTQIMLASGIPERARLLKRALEARNSPAVWLAFASAGGSQPEQGTASADGSLSPALHIPYQVDGGVHFRGWHRSRALI